MALNIALLKQGLLCKCPRCGIGALYKAGLTLELRTVCDHCGLDLRGNDSADGPAVFLIFILGVILVPIALWVDSVFHWPLWVHALVWGAWALFLTLGALRPLKSIVIAMLYTYRPHDWK